MAYIGNTPAEAYISISSQTFTTINGTDYVLSSSVTNSEDIALFLNNVRQNLQHTQQQEQPLRWVRQPQRPMNFIVFI